MCKVRSRMLLMAATCRITLCVLRPALLNCTQAWQVRTDQKNRQKNGPTYVVLQTEEHQLRGLQVSLTDTIRSARRLLLPDARENFTLHVHFVGCDLRLYQIFQFVQPHREGRKCAVLAQSPRVLGQKRRLYGLQALLVGQQLAEHRAERYLVHLIRGGANFAYFRHEFTDSAEDLGCGEARGVEFIDILATGRGAAVVVSKIRDCREWDTGANAGS
jgi:hypothetical protein